MRLVSAVNNGQKRKRAFFSLVPRRTKMSLRVYVSDLFFFWSRVEIFRGAWPKNQPLRRAG